MMRILRLALALLLIISLLSPALAELKLCCINVGKGDAILIFDESHAYLIDAGKKAAQEQIERVLDIYQISALDAIFLTHTDKDHSGGLKWLAETDMPIGAIYASKYHPESTREKHPAVKAAEKLHLDVQWLEAGAQIALGDTGAVLTVLAPQLEIPGNEDDNSLVMMLETPSARALLAGDMELAQEALLLQSGADLDCDILKVPNHADGDACSAALIAACTPKVALISTDSSDKVDTPDPRVLRDLRDSGCQIYVTQDYELGIELTLR